MNPLIIDLIRRGVVILKTGHSDSPRVEAELLLGSLIGCSRTELYLLEPEDFNPDDNTLNTYFFLIKQRASGVPLQHLTGKTGFHDCEIIITPGVFIPRPETEILVDTVLEIMKGCESGKILELCTGSGAVGAAIVLKHPDWHVYASDISIQSVHLAKTNIENYSPERKSRIVAGDLLTPFKKNNFFHCIVVNPPYIPTGSIPELPVEVREHDPYKALDGGKDGLYFYRRLNNLCPDYLSDNGFLVLEIGAGMADDVREIMNDNFETVKIQKDLAGIERVIALRLS